MPQSAPYSTNAAPEVKTKVCLDCCATLPVSYFGVTPKFKDGFQKTCRPCRAEYNSFWWSKKHGRRHKQHEPEIIRSVKFHNQAILDLVFQVDRMELRGFDYTDKSEFKVFFGPSEKVGLISLTLFNRSGSVFMEWALSGVKDPKEALLAYLKASHIRLELTDEHVIASKTVIYYI